VVKSGKHTRQKGVVQRYQCKLCGTSFSNDGYFRGKHPIALVQYAVSLYKQGSSLRKVSEEVDRQVHQKISQTTIMNWVHMLNVSTRKGSGDQKSKVVRDLIEVGVVMRFALSKAPEKFMVLDSFIVEDGRLVICH
jgi:hypothetical protein